MSWDKFHQSLREHVFPLKHGKRKTPIHWMPLAIIFVFIRMSKPSLPPLFPSLFCSVTCFLLVIASVKGANRLSRSGQPSLTLHAHARAVCGLTWRHLSCCKLHSHLLVPETYSNCFKIRVSRLFASKGQLLGFLISNPALPASLTFEKRRETLHFNCGFLRWVTYRPFCKTAQKTIKL